MRIFLTRRRYRCSSCKSTLLLPAEKIKFKSILSRTLALLVVVIAFMYVVDFVMQIDEAQRRKGEAARNEDEAAKP